MAYSHMFCTIQCISLQLLLQSDNRSFHCCTSSSCVLHLQIHVILFGVSEGDPEGIYSLRAQLPGGEQLPQETIIAFEDAEDAQRYAGLLEATMEHPSSVVPINPSELLEFCRASGYHCRLERPGSQFMPPYYNVDVTDWERSLRLRSVFPTQMLCLFDSWI